MENIKLVVVSRNILEKFWNVSNYFCITVFFHNDPVCVENTHQFA